MFRPIIVDNNLQELTQHGTTDFPMSMDEQIVAQEGCHQIYHWHYEIQIALVTQGTVIFRTPDGTVTLTKGQGLFINSGVLHEADCTDERDGVYICVNFSPSLIAADKDGVIYRDYVKPILHSTDLQTIVLSQDSWHKDVLNLLHQMSRCNEDRVYGYELQLHTFLCQIWHLILVHHRHLAARTATISFADSQRIRTLEEFIHQNYTDPITLIDIANAGHISRGECCRVFQRTNKISPITYLKNYRISQSLKLLTCTHLSIAEIAYQVGFQSSSYYTACFRKEQNCTPIEYRLQHSIASTQAGDVTAIHTNKE